MKFLELISHFLLRVLTKKQHIESTKSWLPCAMLLFATIVHCYLTPSIRRSRFTASNWNRSKASWVTDTSVALSASTNSSRCRMFFFLIPFFMWSRQCGCLTACYWSLFLTCECVDDTKAWTWKWMTLSLRLFFYCETSRNSLLLINGRGNTAKSTYWASIARWISFRVHGLVWSKLSWHWRGLRKIIFEYFK